MIPISHEMAVVFLVAKLGSFCQSITQTRFTSWQSDCASEVHWQFSKSAGCFKFIARCCNCWFMTRLFWSQPYILCRKCGHCVTWQWRSWPIALTTLCFVHFHASQCCSPNSSPTSIRPPTTPHSICPTFLLTRRRQTDWRNSAVLWVCGNISSDMLLGSCGLPRMPTACLGLLRKAHPNPTFSSWYWEYNSKRVIERS